MTLHEIELSTALASCSMLPGTSQKRFARQMGDIARLSPDKEISLRQRHYLELMAWRYRRQMPAHLVPPREPIRMPTAKPKRKKQREACAQIGAPPSEQLTLNLSPRAP